MSVIEVRDLNRTFDGKKVLRGLNFSVEKGEVFGFLGPNGAGKTTTLRILLGLLRASSGEALVFGASLANQDRLRRRVGVLLENNGIYDRLSARENLDYYARLYAVEEPRAQVEEMLEFAGLTERADDLVGTFSAGMKRKLGLARAIIHDPELLLLDEPTSGLDPEAQVLVRDLILRLSGQEAMTVFMNSHHLAEVERVCSKVAILHHGSIQAFDTVEHLRAGSGMPRLSLSLADPEKTATALDLLSQLPSVSRTEREGNRILVTLTRGSPASPILTRLIQEDIGVEEATKVSRSLEEIYLGVVQEAEGSA
ncbi:MAG: ABC transporter ATP-binding protein [Methanomicrobiales archaeon]|nr:ABC transporter ATP-binding protein [Methanomicrobiales archaeon]